MKKNVYKDEAEITAGMKVSLVIRSSGNTEGSGISQTLSSFTEEIFPDGTLLIHAPIRNGMYYPLPRDTEFNLFFCVGPNPDEICKMYELPVEFGEFIEKDGLKFVTLLRCGLIKFCQRRECFRVNCSLPVKIERFNGSGSTQPVAGQMVNFSEGGMLFVSDENIDKGERINLSFCINDDENISAVVVRCEAIEEKAYRYKTAVQFIIKDERQRRRFSKFVNDVQYKRMRAQRNRASFEDLLN
mgnify:CR=1 FL=1